MAGLGACDCVERALPWRTLSRAAAVVAAAAVLLLAPARPAAAHAALAGSDPANGASLSRVPAAVVLRFTENLAASASSAQLFDGTGQPVAGAHPVAGSGRELTVRLPRLAAGSYAVAWRVSGVSDGHPTEGVLVFTVERSASQASPGTVAARDPLGIFLRWLRMVLLVGLLGGLAIAGPVLAPAAAGDPDRLVAAIARRIRRRAIGIATACAGGAAVVALTDLAPRPVDALRLGQVAVFGAVVPVLLAIRRAVTRPAAVGYPSPIAWWIAAALGGAAGVLEAAVGGAYDAPEHRDLAVAMASVHVLAGCLVLGLVGVLAALLWPGGLTGARHAAVVRSLLASARGPTPFRRPLVRLAVLSAAVATATGLYGAGRDLDSVQQLPHTLRGQLLLLQAALVLAGGWLARYGVARLAGGRGRATTPRSPALPSPGPPPQSRRSPSRRLLAAGLACGLALLASGVVTDSAGAGGPARAAAPPTMRDGRLDDLVVSVSVVPNRPGLNGFAVQVASSRRPAPAPVERVALTYQGAAGTVAVPLAALGSGRFFGTGTLGPDGVARLVTVVHRSGADESVPVDWPAPAGPVAPVAGGLAGLLDVSAWLMLSLAIGLAAWWLVLSRRRWRVDV